MKLTRAYDTATFPVVLWDIIHDYTKLTVEEAAVLAASGCLHGLEDWDDDEAGYRTGLIARIEKLLEGGAVRTTLMGEREVPLFIETLRKMEIAPTIRYIVKQEYVAKTIANVFDRTDIRSPIVQVDPLMKPKPDALHGEELVIYDEWPIGYMLVRLPLVVRRQWVPLAGVVQETKSRKRPCLDIHSDDRECPRQDS